MCRYGEDLSVPASLVAAAVVAVEGAAAVVAGLGFVVAALAGHPNDRPTAIALGVILAVLGAGLVLVARGLHRERRWARSPAFLVQVFALVVAWNQRETLTPVAVVLAVAAVAGIAALAAVLRESSGGEPG